MLKKSLLTLIFCVVAVGIFAQEEKQSDKAFLMFLHGGYCILPNKTAGLTSTSDDYVKKLSSGASWNAQAYFRYKKLIAGLMYSGFTSKGSYIASEIGTSGLTSSDNLITTYTALQCGMNIPIGKVFEFGFHGGFGVMWLKNNGLVYEKQRVLKAWSPAVNLGINGIVNISKNVGLSAEIMAIGASTSKSKVNYNNKVVEVRYQLPLKLNELTFSLGLKISI